ncbi:MAG: hypothetical protein AAB522_02685 [Patescibacteria group bacterium]
MDHPNMSELNEFWKTGKYTNDLLKTRNFAVNFAVASNPKTSLKTIDLLLEIHPDHPDLSDIEDSSKRYIGGQSASDIDIRLAIAQNATYQKILEVLQNDSRLSVKTSAQTRINPSDTHAY